MIPYRRQRKLKTQKPEPMNRFVGMAIALCCVDVGCGEPAESESLKEARKLHDQLTRISGDLHEAMQASLMRIEEEIEASRG